MGKLCRATFVFVLPLLLMLIVWQSVVESSNPAVPSLEVVVGQEKTLQLYQGILANDALKRGYRAMTPWVAISDYPVFAYPGQSVTVTVAWGNIPIDSRYILRAQLENKLQWPHRYYFTDIANYNAAETQTITIPIPMDADPRYGSRFVAAFISTTATWDDVLAIDFRPADVTIESNPPSGWTSGQFRLADPDAGAFLDPEGQPFYVRGMTYDYQRPADLTVVAVVSQLAYMKALGFNAVNLYPRFGFNTDEDLRGDFLPEILSWADHNRMAVYIRTWYKYAPVFPDYIDPQYRQQAKDSLEAVLDLARPHPSVLAVDLDQRWLFDVDWRGERRYGTPQLVSYTLAYLPTWLQGRFGTIDALNTAWDKNYVAFADVLSDAEVVRDGQVLDLERHPWRVDLVEYVLWVMDDFMADVISYTRSIDPDHLYTYTNDRAEVIPFPISTRASSGINFISPAHYNFSTDFYRDWVSQAKLTQETLWQRDLYRVPAFVRESGWRTETLSQTPPLTDYAWSLGERHKAELYLQQATLMAAYPWIPGWVYFKWYDKPVEGDFGFLSDDGSRRSIANLAECINPVVQVNTMGRLPPQRWIYYPRYALAAPYPAYEHYKTLVEILEHNFFSVYEEQVVETLSLVSWPLTMTLTTTDCASITNTSLFTRLVDVFNQRWQPFAFTSTLPTDGFPILLAGRALEPLSPGDRNALAQKYTVTFGPVGVSDERYRWTPAWYAEVVGLTLGRVTITSTWPPGPAICILSYPATAPAGRSVDVAVEWRNLPADAAQNYKLIVQLENWDVNPGLVYLREFTNFDIEGSLTVTLDIPAQVLTYTRPVTGSRYVAAFISKTVGWGALPLAFDTTSKGVSIQPQRWVTVTTPSAATMPGGLACPAWTGWTARPLTGTYHTLATFQGGELDGQPAIVQSADGQHTAFLYDALLWRSITSDSDKRRIEESLACHNLLLQLVILTPYQVYLPIVLK